VARTALILFLWLLPFHSLVIALLFGYFGVSAETARAVAHRTMAEVRQAVGLPSLRTR